MVSLPKGLERRVQTCSFATEEGIADSVSAANELSSCMQGFKCVTRLFFNSLHLLLMFL